VAVRDIPIGVEISKTGEGAALIAKCLIHDEDVAWRNCTLKFRKSFPSHPGQVMGNCGYWFEDKRGRRLIRKEIETGRFVIVAEEE